MKLTDKIVKKFGVDKVLHFMGGALITAICAIFGFTGAIVGASAAIILSFVKEAVFDTEFDRADLAAGCLGAVVAFGIAALILLL
jgi:hypothetical protein